MTLYFSTYLEINFILHISETTIIKNIEEKHSVLCLGKNERSFYYFHKQGKMILAVI